MMMMIPQLVELKGIIRRYIHTLIDCFLYASKITQHVGLYGSPQTHLFSFDILPAHHSLENLRSIVKIRDRSLPNGASHINQIQFAYLQTIIATCTNKQPYTHIQENKHAYIHTCNT